MQRIITKTVDDVAVAPEEIVDTLNIACTRRQDKYKVQGVCQIEERIYFVLVPLLPSEPAKTYVLVAVEESSHDDVVAMLDTRWSSNFDILGTIKVYETTYILFAKPADKTS